MKLMTLFIVSMIALFGCAEQQQETQDDGGMTFLTGESDIQTDERLTRSVVASHDSLDSCYVIINGDVYDMTDYIEFSPLITGTDKDEFRGRLISSCGNDGTILFRELYGDNHLRLESYYLGELA